MGRPFVGTVADYIARHQLLDDDERVLVGVSGGVDSMVCASVLVRLGYEVHVLHANYGLRSGADADESLVRRWCAEQTPRLPLHVEQLDAENRADARNESLQESARTLRYDALEAHTQHIDADVVAVGHHRDDQAETLLLNLVRGTGPEGLAGMPPARPIRGDSIVSLVRPLLGVSRTKIETYATEESIPWREDPSNRNLDYDRAKIRTEVLPVLQEHFDAASANVAHAAELLGAYVDHTLTPALQERLERCYVSGDRGGQLDLEALRAEPSVWRRRLILAVLEDILPSAPYTAPVAREIEALIDAQVGRRVEVGSGTVWRERESLYFLPSEAGPEEIGAAIPVPWGEEVPATHGTLRIDLLDSSPTSLDSGTSTIEYADADRLADPLFLRSWRDGDRIRPLGLDGSKLVSDLLTDLNVSPHRRGGVGLLCTDAHPVWVVGYRLDHRVRVRPDTTTVARLRWRPREKESDDCNSA